MGDLMIELMIETIRNVIRARARAKRSWRREEKSYSLFLFSHCFYLLLL